jgi:hypothetical protein
MFLHKLSFLTLFAKTVFSLCLLVTYFVELTSYSISKLCDMWGQYSIHMLAPVSAFLVLTGTVYINLCACARARRVHLRMMKR